MDLNCPYDQDYPTVCLNVRLFISQDTFKTDMGWAITECGRIKPMTEYKPITPQQQPKFAGIKTFMRLPHTQIIEGIDFAVAGVPWDGATSYRTGQRLGPDAIRKVSVTLRPFNLALDVDVFEHC
ncbi:arginase family protein, partial [bacterium]|nr:arginase family protein [bacterium]